MTKSAESAEQIQRIEVSEQAMQKILELQQRLNAPPEAVVNEHENRIETPIDDGIVMRKIRSLFGGNPATEETVYYSKTVAGVRSDFSGEQPIEIYGRHVIEPHSHGTKKLLELSILGIKDDWDIHLEFNEDKSIKNAVMQRGEDINHLSADQLEELFSPDVSFNDNERYMQERIDEKIIKDFKQSGGNIESVLYEDVPDGANVVSITSVGEKNAENINVRARKITRPDGTVVYAVGKTLTSALPTDAELLTAASAFNNESSTVGAKSDEVHTTEESKEKEKPAEHGEKEKLLGVAVNRETQKLQFNKLGTTSLHYNDTSGTVGIDIEHDVKLQEFLGEFTELKSETANLSRAAKAAQKVVELTPKIDTDGGFHNKRGINLGEALTEPVECVDRALAMEATFNMLAVGDAIKMLPSIDRFDDGTSENHVDVSFNDSGETHVAITMGERAGQIISDVEYRTTYIEDRKRKGLGQREIKDTWIMPPYFEKVTET